MAGLNQRELAKLARVSQATVSRVLNNDPKVNAAARERVQAIIASHDYVPDSRAQSLRGRRSGALGLVVHRAPQQLAADPFFSALIVAILQVGNARGYHLFVDTARTLESRRTVHEELLRTRRVDGLILVESESQDDRIDRLVAHGFPFALIGRYDADPKVLSVDNDNLETGRMVTARLLAQGRCRIAYIGGPEGITVSEDRLEGYRWALTTQGVRFDPALVRNGDFSEAGAFRAMLDLLDTGASPDALVAVDDVTAIGAMRAARLRQLRIPQDMAVVGFNDSLFCPYFDPPLSSVSIDISGLARIATEMLIERIEGRDVNPSRRIVPCRLIERESS